MKRLSSFALIGALSLASLTACSSEKGDIADFCAVSDSLAGDGGFTLDDLSDSAMEDALAGDMAGVNEWGNTAVASIDFVASQLADAKGGAPTDEASKALDDMGEGLDVMRGFATSASKAADFETLMVDAEALTADFEAIDAKMTAASDVLDAAAAEYCK